MRTRSYLRLGVVGIPFLFLIITLGLGPGGATYLWRLVGVPALFPRFSDSLVITDSWECARRGIDVLKTNLCDPWSRPMNYPRLWLLPGNFGLGTSSTAWLAIAMVFAFLVSVYFLLGPITPRQAIYCLLITMSFPVMLAIERGNNDLLVFALLVAVAVALTWNHRTGPFIAGALILLATALKLYPIAAVHALFLGVRGKQHQLLTVAVVAIAAVYAFAIRQTSP